MSENELNSVILPIEYLEPVLSWYEPNPDYSQSDALIESENLLARQDQIELVLVGEAHPDSALELMLDQGKDVDAYIDEVVSNLSFIS